MTSINTNTAALMASASSRTTESKLVRSFERLSTGSRVNSAADDAAGLAVSNRMSLQLRSMNQAIGNSANGVSLLKTALSGIEEINNIIQRMRELSIRAANGTFTDIDRSNSQKEVDALLNEITRIADQTSFNQVNLLDGTYQNFVRAGISNEELVHINLGGMGILGSVRGTQHADGTSLSILRERSSGLGRSQFNTALSSLASGFSEILMKNRSEASGTSSFDTPSLSTGFNGVSVIALLAQVQASGVSISDRQATSTGTGSSSIDVLGIEAASGNSTFDTPVNATATGTSTLIGSTLVTSVASAGLVAAGGASTFTTASFNNGDFESNIVPITNPDGSISIPGWTIFLEQVRLAPFDVPDPTDTTRFIDGWPTPTDPTPFPSSRTRPGWVSSGDDDVTQSQRYTWSIDSGSLKLESFIDFFSRPGHPGSGGGQVNHGPYVISDDSVSLIAGDRVLFDWRAQGGGDDADVYAFLLEENTGNTIELLDANAPRAGAAPWQSSDVTVTVPGDYKYVFVSGTFDESFGMLAGASLQIDNIRVISNRPPTPVDTTGAATFESEEVLLPGSEIVIDIDDLTSLQTQVAADPGAAATPIFTLSGPDAAAVRFNASGDLVLDGPLRFVDKDQFVFDVEYLATTGVTHTETVTLNLTQSLRARANLDVHEAQNITVPRTLTPDFINFANNDFNRGTFRFANSGTSIDITGNFEIDGTGQITSRNPVEFDNTPVINLDVEYRAFDGRVFQQEVVLNVEDTLTSTATITAEQANDVRVNLNTLSSSKAYSDKYAAAGWNVSYDIIPTFGDSAFFTVNPTSGNISSTAPLLISNKPNYSFQLRTTVNDGVNTIQHVETVNLSLTESLQATSSITAQEADLITIADTEFASIDSFATRDGNLGAYRLESGSGDHNFFIVNPTTGVVSTNAATQLEYNDRANFFSAMNMDPQYSFDVVYRASDGREFRETVNLELTDTLTAQSNLTSEQSDEIVIEANTLSSTAAFARNHRLSGNAGLFSIDRTSPQGAFFEVDQTGRVTANRQLLAAVNPTVQFDVLFEAWNGKLHRETVTMDITESLQAAATIDVYEARDKITVGVSELDNINDFARRDFNRGSFRIAGGRDFRDFTVDRTSGTISSRSGVEFDNNREYQVAIEYIASDLRVFTETVTLNIKDTFFGSSNLEAEQSEQVTIKADTLTSMNAFVNKKALSGINGDYAIEATGSSWSKFNITDTGDIEARDILYEGNTHTFTVSFRADDGEIFYEEITLLITEPLQAKSIVAADEASSVRIGSEQMREIQAFADRDNRDGMFRIVASGNDYEKFTVTSDGSVMSKNALEFDDPLGNINEFAVAYFASDGRIFTQHIELTLGDTFSGTSIITAEESKEVVFLLSDMSSLRSYVNKVDSGGVSGDFSILKTGSDFDKFEIDEFGNVRAIETLRKDEQEIFQFQVHYKPAIGESFTETVNLYLIDTTYNKSLSKLQVKEAETVSIGENALPDISSFAAADNYMGEFVIAASDEYPEDRNLFDIDQRGVITSRKNFDYEIDKRYYEFSVIYTSSNGTSYQNFVELEILNDQRDDDNLNLELLNIETVENANNASVLLNEAVNRVASSMAYVGAIQNRLEHNIDNLSSSEFLLGLSRGRIVDADMAIEASKLAKNTILSDSAKLMMANSNNSKQLLLELLS